MFRLFSLFSILLCLLLSTEAADKNRPNVLMIAIDDLRPMLGCYGDDRIHSPHIDRLAARSILFERAYCNYAKCGASRLSLMTGLRPDQIRVVGHGVKDVAAFRKRQPNATTMARWLLEQGYETRSFGKIDHDGWQQREDWSAPPSPGREREMWEVVDEKNPLGPTRIAERLDCPVLQNPDVPDDHLFAGRMTNDVLQLLSSRKDERPFFYAVGFRRPHLPFVAPKRYFDLYQPDESWLTTYPDPPIDAPPFAWFNSDGYIGSARNLGFTMPNPPNRSEAMAWNGFEMRSYVGAPVHGEIPADEQLKFLHAYAACISYVDTQVGRLLDFLEEKNLLEETVVVLWSDHGWHLGEMSAWGKMTNYEVSTRIPFLVSAPRITPARTTAFAELVDLYPTLCDLTTSPKPDHLEGTSLVPILKNPEAKGKDAVFHEYLRYKGKFQGRAIRTDRFRFVEWRDPKENLKAVELYDLQKDPHETRNIAGASPETVARLSRQLAQGPAS